LISATPLFLWSGFLACFFKTMLRASHSNAVIHGYSNETRDSSNEIFILSNETLISSNEMSLLPSKEPKSLLWVNIILGLWSLGNKSQPSS